MNSTIDMLLTAMNRSKIPRSGWVQRNITNPESIGAHIQKVMKAALYFGMAHPEYDTWKLSSLATFHEMGELLGVQDYTPGEINPLEKFKQEYLAIAQANDPEMLNSFLEFEYQSSPEAQIVYQLDKFCPTVQALEEEKRGYVEQVKTFFPYTRERISHPTLVKTYDILMKREFPHIRSYLQYYALILAQGNEEHFKEVVIDLPIIFSQASTIFNLAEHFILRRN